MNECHSQCPEYPFFSTLTYLISSRSQIYGASYGKLSLDPLFLSFYVLSRHPVCHQLHFYHLLLIFYCLKVILNLI